MNFPDIIKSAQQNKKELIHLSQDDYNRFMLNIKDKNIFFKKKPKEEVIKGVKTKVFYATLKYKLDICPLCGERHTIINYGYKETSIKMLRISEQAVVLKLKKRRFFCNNCKKSFLAETDLVSKYCSISNNVKWAIKDKLRKNISEKNIAEDYDVSHNTVGRIIDDSFKRFQPNFKYLPEILCFDEFKSTKDAEGAMSFIYCDFKTRKILDILPYRNKEKLRSYFLSFPLKVRKKVKHIVTDMYSPYIKLAKELFPKAKISIDRFHLVQLFNRSFNKVRVEVMNACKNKDPRYYNKLKKYWKLLLTAFSKLSENKVKKGKMFDGNFVSEKDIVDKMLPENTELKASYDLYQDFSYCIREKHFRRLIRLLKDNPKVPAIMKTSLRTIKKYLLHIKNSLAYSYSNGVIEGLNCKIKALKRTAYGYKSFFHFRNRILIQNFTLAA